MEQNDLHSEACALAPRKIDNFDHFMSKAKHYIVAVLRHDQENWSDAEPAERFLWLKGRKSHTLDVFRRKYIEVHEQPGLDIQLLFDGSNVKTDYLISSLDRHGDRIVALSALRTHNVEQSIVGAVPLESEIDPSKRTTSLPGSESRKMELSLSENPLMSPQPETPKRAVMKGEAFSHTTSVGTPSRTPLKPISLQIRASPRSLNIEAKQDRSNNTQNENADDPSCGNEQAIVSRTPALQRLIQQDVPERLEAGVRVGLEALSRVSKPLQQVRQTQDVKMWLSRIEEIREEAVKSRTVVGVVGNTGAGKSSVINAMLDEERLVPTNCMRACTAVVTELSYNESNSRKSRYRARIEFIQPEDWRKELTILFKEVFDDKGRINHEARNAETEAGIACAKIRAVYHKCTVEQLARSNVDELMDDESVKSILGTAKNINESTADAFYLRLQNYVDSKEKGTENLDKLGRKIVKKRRPLEYWPLIKVVKIYTKAEALSTGAVIVDLPGVHDSNAARAAVAEGYMKQCTGLWIVAPITRAVDDKAAKNLLGDTFKRQLKYDGIYSAVTFICSKTDDISRTEATESLNLGARMAEIEDELSRLTHERKSLQIKHRDAKANVEDHIATIDDIDNEVDIWEELELQAEEGIEVFAPCETKAKKRRHAAGSASNEHGRKKIRCSDGFKDDVTVICIDEESETAPEDASNQPPSEPLTLKAIEEKLSSLKTLKRETRKAKQEISMTMADMVKELEEIQRKTIELESRQDEICIAGRNEYSRKAIRQDFAAGVRELDQENAIEEDEDDFDPDEDLRDYDEVGRSLPVFCVSSRAYQKLCGRLKKDNDVAGFTNIEQTEVPSLQAHCKQLTERGRQANCRRFLNSLNLLLLSLRLWADEEPVIVKITSEQRKVERDFLNRQLERLESSLDETINRATQDMTDSLGEKINNHYPTAVQNAVSRALPTSTKWSGPRDDGGLFFSTYRAVTRRYSVYHSPTAGALDFNAQLAEPLYKRLASNWERVFQRSIPHIFDRFAKSTASLLDEFRTTMRAACRGKDGGTSRLGLINLSAYRAIFADIAQDMVALVNERQEE